MRIDYNAFEAFRKTLPEGVRHEQFRADGEFFSIPMALFLIDKLALQRDEIQVEAFANEYGLFKDDDVPWMFLTGVDEHIASRPNIDTSVPVIFLMHTHLEEGKEVCGGLLIDGYKRLRRAFMDGLKTIPAYVIPQEPSKLVKL